MHKPLNSSPVPTTMYACHVINIINSIKSRKIYERGAYVSNLPIEFPSVKHFDLSSDQWPTLPPPWVNILFLLGENDGIILPIKWFLWELSCAKKGIILHERGFPPSLSCLHYRRLIDYLLNRTPNYEDEKFETQCTKTYYIPF